MASEEEKRIEDELSHPIVVSERVRSAVDEAESFKLECSEVGKHVDRISHMLRTLARLATATPSLYERPIRRVVAEVSRNLERALTLLRKCKHRSVLRRVVSITGAADFRKLFALLESSAGDMTWLVSIFDAAAASGGGGGIVSLPPIASNDPIISWVWSSIATIQMSQLAADRADAASQLASLAQDNDRNKKIIIEEGGVPPLLKLLKESASPEAQVAASAALCNLADNQERVHVIVAEHGIPAIVQVLGDSPIRVQTKVASLVARMAENNEVAQDDFARENVIRPLVTLLSLETFVDDSKLRSGKHSIHSLVQINKEMERHNPSAPNRVFKSMNSIGMSNSHSYSYVEGSSKGGNHRKEWENETPENKAVLKIGCAEALWRLATGSVANSRRITETKGLLCLAKMVENETGELQFNCLTTIAEITAAAESNSDLRRAAFKTNAHAAKAVVDQLLRLITKEDETPTLQILAIQSIGSLARTFPARETRVIGPLASHLGNREIGVATEAAIALGKFAAPENFLHTEHSKTIIEFNGVPPLLKLLRLGDGAMLHGLFLLCCLALHGGNNDALDQARVSTALEGADRAVVAQHPKLRELVPKALYHLNLYHNAGGHSQRFNFVP